MNKKRFFQNAFMLIVSTFLLRLVFTAFRVVVSNKVGAECMGLYQLTFAIYNVSVTFATSGINFAVTRLIAKALSKNDRAGAKKVMRLSIAYSLAFGLAAFLIVFALSEKIGIYLLCDERSVLSLKAFALSLPFISVSSAVSGYFYAARNVPTTLISRVLEQAAQIAFFYIFMQFVPDGNIELSCCVIVAASAVSEVLGSVYLIAKFVLEYRGQPSGREKGVFKKLCAVALPSAAGAYLKSGLQTVENVLIPIGFRKFGASQSDALKGYGILCSMVMPVIFFPSFVFASFSMLLIPEFTEAQTLKKNDEIKRTAGLAIRLTLMFSLFISANFIVFGQSIGNALYTEKDAGALIKMMAPLIPFMYLDSIADGMLKGLGEYNRVLKYSSIDTVVSITMIYFVVSKHGLYGYIVVIYTSTMLNAFLSIRRLLVVSKNRLEFFSDIVVPFCASLFSALCSKLLLMPLSYSGGKVFFVVTALLGSAALLTAFILISRGKMYETVKYAVRTVFALKPKSNFNLACRINNN